MCDRTRNLATLSRSVCLGIGSWVSSSKSGKFDANGILVPSKSKYAVRLIDGLRVTCGLWSDWRSFSSDNHKARVTVVAKVSSHGDEGWSLQYQLPVF